MKQENFFSVKETDQWKIDLTSIFPVPLKALGDMIDGLGVSQTDFALQSLGDLTGNTPDRTLLNPLKSR